MFQRSFRRNRFQPKSKSRGFQRGRQAPHPSTHVSRYINKEVETGKTQEYTAHHQFSDFPIAAELKNNIATRGYTTPTPIQDQAIPPILGGRDVIGIANTGTGKTAAFLIPLIHKIIQNRSERALIVVPTRELAVQIEEELKAFARHLHIASVLCIGGLSVNHQIFALRQNPNIVIGTPGRLKDLIERKFLHLSQFKYIVLDEVDRMVDIGFIHDIKYIISLLPGDRQSLFFAATVSPDLNPIIHSFLKTPITISVKVKETAERIDQDVIHVKDKNEKIEKLFSLLRQPEEFKKVLIFGRTKWGVERLAKNLAQHGFRVASIHGNKSQNQRLRALSQFKQNQLQVLVATDIAARGLDIEDVSHVVNFDEPGNFTDYVHRIGRTGRANKYGKALTFVENR